MSANNNQVVTINGKKYIEFPKYSTAQQTNAVKKIEFVKKDGSSSALPKKLAKKNNKEAAKANRSQMSDNSISYNGPLFIPASHEEVNIAAMNFSLSAVLTDTSGTINFALGTGTMLQSVTDWASLAAVWHEYRVLAMRFKYFPHKFYPATTGASIVNMVVVDDRGAGNTLGSYDSGYTHESAKTINLSEKGQMLIRMNGPEEAVWTATASTLNWGYIKGYATACTPTGSTWGRYVITLLVQFRGRA